MVVYVQITVNSSVFSDILDCSVESSVSEFGISSNFSCTLPNYGGRHKADFTVGNDVLIEADTSNPATTDIFRGIIEDIEFEGEGPDEIIRLTGRDYTARLMDETVEPEIYSNAEVSTIVNDIFDKYVVNDNVTRTGVTVTTTTLPRITFNQVTVYEAYKRLAELSGFIFFIDTTRNLQFIRKGITSSGLTLNNTNVMDAKFRQTRDGMYNKIWIYGDRALTAAVPEVFTPSGGSVFTVTYKPHNTNVSWSGTVRLGGVFQFLPDPGSMQYAVNFHDRQIIFISGTTAGNNVPVSNVGSIVINYDREIPIVKYGTDNTSISNFGALTRVIHDKNIKDPRTAEDRLITELENSSNPPVRGDLHLKGIVNVTAGNTIIVNLPNFNINSQTYDIISARWDFNVENNQSEKVLTLTVNKKMQEFTDKIVKVIQDIKELKAGDISPEDIITRYEFAIGSVRIVGSYWEVQTRTLGSSFILGDQTTGSAGGTIVRLGLLGSSTGSVSFLGDSRTAFTIARSGAET